MPDGNVKQSGKVMWSQSQYAPRTCHGTLVVSCWLLAVSSGGGDIIGRGDMRIFGGGFVGMSSTLLVGRSPLLSLGGSFVVDGGLEPP